MRKLFSVITAAAVGLAAMGGGSFAADDLQDARVIVTAKSNTVKKWHYPPRIVVVHDQPVDRVAFAEVPNFIATATGLPIEQPTFVNLTDDEFNHLMRFLLAANEPLKPLPDQPAEDAGQ